MADKLPEATVRPSSADTRAIAIQAAVVAQVPKQMGLGNGKENKHGPKPVHSKDLAPSDVKTFSGTWLEFANWWTMLKSTLAAASPEWRIILDRLLEYPKRRIASEDLEHITGKSEVEAHLAYSNELCTLTARLTKLSKSMTLANSQNASSGGTQAPDLAAQFQLQAELGAWLPYSPTRPTNTPNPSPIRRLTERYSRQPPASNAWPRSSSSRST